MAVRKINNPHIKGLSGRLEVAKDGTSLTRVLRVETGLSLDPLDPSYDQAAEAQLVADVTEHLGDVFDRAEYVTVTT